MSDTREKLIEIIIKGGCDSADCDRCEISGIDIFKCLRKDAGLKADQIIKSGVTVQEWIPVSERLPEKEEYTAKSKDGTEYYVQLLIAYKTDIVEYEIGYYDGYKWLSEMPMRIIKDVIAWKQFEPLPQPPEAEK